MRPCRNWWWFLAYRGTYHYWTITQTDYSRSWNLDN